MAAAGIRAAGGGVTVRAIGVVFGVAAAVSVAVAIAVAMAGAGGESGRIGAAAAGTFTGRYAAAPEGSAALEGKGSLMFGTTPGLADAGAALSLR